MKMSAKKKLLKACSSWGKRLTVISMISVVVACGINPANAGALSAEQQKLFNHHILRFNWNDQVCGDGGGQFNTPGGSGGGGPSIWNSGLQPPYILEQFAIETLKAVAAKRGVPPSATVTEQHVQGLIAFMYGEGGDINNTSSIFNPLNTGLNAPELLDPRTPPRGDGVQSFKSFDAGVEATARTMVGSFQSRLADAVINPSSTAEQFLEALSFWYRYPGNHPWAEASRGREGAYYQERLNLLAQVRARYAEIAGLIIGTMELEQQARRTDPSKLVYGKTPGSGAIGGGAGGAAANSNCAGGNVIAGCNPPAAGTEPAQILVSTALCLAWDTKGGHVITPDMMIERGCGAYCDGGASKSKPEYVTAQRTFNKYTNINPFSDCGIYTATIIHASGIDSSYPKRLTTTQRDYALRNPSKWEAHRNVMSTAQIRPGDILISTGHTYIYTGPYKSNTNGQEYNAAQASLAWTSPGHAPEAANFWTEAGYTAFRFVGTPSGSAAPMTGGNNRAL